MPNTSRPTSSRMSFTLDKLCHEMEGKVPNLIFDPIPSKEIQGKIRERLLVGVYQNQKKSNVYAYVQSGNRGIWNLVDLRVDHTHGVHEIKLYCSGIVEKSLANIEYAYPFNLIPKSATYQFRNELRYTILFYFLQNRSMRRITLTSLGLKQFRGACTKIAEASTRDSMCRRTQAPQVIVSSKQADKLGVRPAKEKATLENVKSKAVCRLDPQPNSVSITAPENESTRAVTTMVLNDDTVAAHLIPELPSSSSHGCQPINPPSLQEQKVTAIVPQLKRKWSSTDTQSEPRKAKTPEDIFAQCRQLVQSRSKKLKRNEQSLRNALEEKTKTLAEDEYRVANLEEELSDARKLLVASKKERDETEIQLEKIQQEVKNIETFDQGFEGFTFGRNGGGGGGGTT